MLKEFRRTIRKLLYGPTISILGFRYPERSRFEFEVWVFAETLSAPNWVCASPDCSRHE